MGKQWPHKMFLDPTKFKNKLKENTMVNFSLVAIDIKMAGQPKTSVAVNDRFHCIWNDNC